jgi:hypothetical protein
MTMLEDVHSWDSKFGTIRNSLESSETPSDEFLFPLQSDLRLASASQDDVPPLDLLHPPLNHQPCPIAYDSIHLGQLMGEQNPLEMINPQQAVTLFDQLQRLVATNLEPLSPVSPEDHSNETSINSGCSCYSYILRRLVEFENKRALGEIPSALDTVLVLERNIQDQINQVLQCQICSTSRPDLFMMLNVSFYHFISFVEQIFPCDNENKLASSFDGCLLLLGSVEIGAQEKIALIQQLLVTRFQSLSSSLRELRQQLNLIPQNIFCTVGLAVFSQIELQLHAVIGKFQALS